MKEIFYDWGGFNVWLFHAINNVRGEMFDAFMQWGTALGDHSQFSVVVALVAVAGLVRAAKPGMETNLWLLVLATFSFAYIADGVLVSWLKQSLDFPRPPLALPAESLHVIGRPELHHSLPSGHANFAMTVAASLWPLFRRNGHAVLVFFVLWVGVSRVSLGMHFPADVVAGSLLGFGVVLSIRLLLVKFVAAWRSRART